MAAQTALRVASDTVSGLFSVRETVIGDTHATRATSSIRTLRTPLPPAAAPVDATGSAEAAGIAWGASVVCFLAMVKMIALLSILMSLD